MCKKISIGFMLLLSTSLWLSGCGELAMVELSEEQASQVAEYATGLLLKDALNYSTRLVDTDQMIAQLATEREEQRELAAKVDKIKQAQAQVAAQEREEKENGNSHKSTMSEPVLSSNIESALQLTDISVEYQNYQILDSYPEDSDMLLFAMDATPGQKLLVLHFNVRNNGVEEQLVDMTSGHCRFRGSINHEGYTGFLSTLLLNDLHMFRETLGPGESQDAVLVTEIPEDFSVETISIMIKKDGEQTKFRLE